MSANLDPKLMELFDKEINKLPKNAAKANIDAIDHAYSQGMKFKGIAEVLSKHLGHKVATGAVRDAFYEKHPEKKPAPRKAKVDGDKGKKDQGKGTGDNKN